MRGVRPIPPRLLPHISAVKIERSLGANADGRKWGQPETPPRSLIVDGSGLVNGKTDPQSTTTGTVYIPADSLVAPPVPESRITIWVGTAHQRVGKVDSFTRYFDPRIGDLFEIRLK